MTRVTQVRRRNARRLVALKLTIATTVAVLAIAGVAAAGIEYFFSGGLSPGRSFASTSAHSYVSYARAYTNHTACVGRSNGWAGYAPPGSGSVDGFACGINPGGSAPGGPIPDYRHGWVGNGNEITDVSLSDAYYQW